MKDKRKFGGASKNRNCKKFGYSYDKEVRRIWRIEARQLAHKILMHLPVSREEIQAAWSNPYTDSSVLGVPYIWDGDYDRWVEQQLRELSGSKRRQ